MPKFISRNQFEVIKVLKKRGATIKDISEATGVSKGAVSRNSKYATYEDYLATMYSRRTKYQKEVEAKSGPVVVVTPASKACSKCGKVKAIDEFDKVKVNRDGHSGMCKECRREKQRNYKKTRKTAKKVAKKPEVVRNEHIAVYAAPSCPGWNSWPEPRAEEKEEDEDVTYAIGERVYVYIDNKVKKGIVVAVDDKGYSADYIVGLDGLFCHKNVKVGPSNVFRRV